MHTTFGTTSPAPSHHVHHRGFNQTAPASQTLKKTFQSVAMSTT